MENILLTVEEHVAVIRFNNPPVNVATLTLIRELSECIRQIEVPGDTRCIVIASALDKAFMAGADITNFAQMLKQPGTPLTLVEETNQLLSYIESMPVPVIAAIKGLTLGAGLELSLACDLRIADETASFGLPEIKLGLFPGGGGTQRLSRLIGVSRTKRMIFTGEPIQAQTALEYGLIDELVPAGEVDQAALALARRIAAFSAKTLGSAKTAVNLSAEKHLQDGLKAESKIFGELFGCEDTIEGIEAFAAKRQPEFNRKK